MAKKRKNSRKCNKKWIFWAAISVLLIAAGVVSYLVWDNYFNKQEVVEEEQETIVIEENVDNSDVVSPDIETVKPSVVKYDDGDPNDGGVLSGAITYSAMNGNNLVFRVNIDQYLSSGECMILLSTAGNIEYSDTVPIVAGVSTATCEGFEVPTANLSGGKYTVEIELTSGGRAGKITGEVEF